MGEGQINAPGGELSRFLKMGGGGWSLSDLTTSAREENKIRKVEWFLQNLYKKYKQACNNITAKPTKEQKIACTPFK